jgi:hypothetical protein
MDTGAHGAAIRRMCLRVVLPSGEMSLCPFRERGCHMTVKHIKEYHCDRCKRIFEKRESQYANTETMEIGWFFYTNGSGSKASAHGRSWENLDYDLCSDCTGEFREWWRNSPERD